MAAAPRSTRWPGTRDLRVGVRPRHQEVAQAAHRVALDVVRGAQAPQRGRVERPICEGVDVEAQDLDACRALYQCRDGRLRTWCSEHGRGLDARRAVGLLEHPSGRAAPNPEPMATDTAEPSTAEPSTGEPSTGEPSTGEPMGRRGAVAGAVTGAVLLGSSAAVHADLYVTGYRHIPTIGSLFLLQVVVGALLALVGVLGAARRGGPGRSLVGPLWAASALFAAGTVVGYAVSRGTTLFGFHDVATTAGLLAGLAEAGAFTVYGSLFLRAARTRRPSGGRVAPVALGFVAAVLVAVVLVDGVGIGSMAGNRPPDTAPHAVTREPSPLTVVHVVISDYDYHPARVVARPGEVIAVTNHDPVTHTLTAIPGSTPYGGFNTGYVDPGRTVRIHAPERPGAYAFYCSIHNFMKGVLVVTK